MCVYHYLPPLHGHRASFNSIWKKIDLQTLLRIHTEIRKDTSKETLEDAYLIYPKDNHINFPPRSQTTLIIFLNKAIIFLLSQ